MIDRSPRRFEACMTRRTLGVAALLLVPALAWPRQGSAQTFKTAKFSIGGDGGTDYLTAEPGTGRVFVSRSTHVIVETNTRHTAHARHCLGAQVGARVHHQRR